MVQTDEPPIVVKFANSRWKRSEVTKRDSNPIILTQNADKEDNNHDIAIAASGTAINRCAGTDKRERQRSCQVCRQNFARYNCPRCGLWYCQVACYQQHSNDDNGHACTEGFHQNRVAAVQRLEILESRDSVQGILSKRYEEDVAANAPALDDADLQLALEQLEMDDTGAVLPQSLPASVRQAFLESLQQGNVWQDILKPWAPWWTATIGHALPTQEQQDSHDVDSNGGGGDDHSKQQQQQQQRKRRSEKTLDERLLKIKPFASICKREPHSSTQFQCIDLLYATVWMLRLHHGIDNAKDYSDAVSTLYMASSAFQGTNLEQQQSLEQTLIQCAERSTKQMELGQCNAEYQILMEDVATLCQNPRLMARALLEAKELIRHAKKQKQQPEQNATKLRMMQKKLDFFLALVMDKQGHIDHAQLSQQIREWANDWKLESDDIRLG